VKDRQRGRSLLGVEAVGVSALPALISTGAGKVTPIGGREPTLEERVDRLEGRVEALNEGLLHVTDRLRAELEEAANKAFNRAYQAMVKRDRSLRLFLHQQLAGDVGRRLGGVVLFVIGALLSAAANVIGA
jgi:hypothetical protein